MQLLIIFEFHDFQGLRPTIPKQTHPKLTELLEKCWQQDPALRPDFSEIIDMLLPLAKEVISSSLASCVSF